MTETPPIPSARVDRFVRLCAVVETAGLVASGLWAGVLAMTGAAAAVVFPTMKSLDPTLPGFAGFTGEHWRLAGGEVAARLFMISDAVQLAAVLVCGAAIGVRVLRGGLGLGRSLALVRLIAFGVAAAAFAAWLFVVGPGMWSDLANYRAAASQGANDAALAFQASFADAHPTASRLMTISFFGALVLFVSSAWSRSAAEARGGPA